MEIEKVGRRVARIIKAAEWLNRKHPNIPGSSSTEDMPQGGYDRDLLNHKWCGKGKWGSIHCFFWHESWEASNSTSRYHIQNNVMWSQAVEHLEEGCHYGCKSLHKFSILGGKTYEGLPSRKTPLLAQQGQDSLFVFGRVLQKGISTFFNYWPHLGQGYGARWAFGSNMAHLMPFLNHLPFTVDQIHCVQRSSSTHSSVNWKGYYPQQLVIASFPGVISNLLAKTACLCPHPF